MEMTIFSYTNGRLSHAPEPEHMIPSLPFHNLSQLDLYVRLISNRLVPNTIIVLRPGTSETENTS